MLRSLHIARTGLGVALANSLRGNDVDAVRWLDAVGSAEGVSQDVASQVFPRRIAVLAAAKRWADRSRASEGQTGTPCPKPGAKNSACFEL